MGTIGRGLLFVAMAVGVAVLVVAVSRRERDRLRASGPRPSDLLEVGNGHPQEAYEEI